MEVRTPAMKTALLTVKPQDDLPGLSTSCYVNWKCLRQQIHYQKICHEKFHENFMANYIKCQVLIDDSLTFPLNIERNSRNGIFMESLT